RPPRPQRLPADPGPRQRHFHARGGHRLPGHRRLRCLAAPASFAPVGEGAPRQRPDRGGWEGQKAPGGGTPGAQSTNREGACSRKAGGPVERRPRRKTRALVVVGALTVINEIEAFALLIGPWPQPDHHLDDREQDEI